jgi:hypothetical protein
MASRKEPTTGVNRLAARLDVSLMAGGASLIAAAAA